MKPLAQIVDENDNIIGHKPRPDIDYQKDIYRVAALWVTNSKGEVLIAQRKLTKDKDPGKWGPAVGGTVEDGETYESNIYKEAEEEIGLTGYQFTLGPKMRRQAERNYFAQYFSVVVDEPVEFFRPQEEEVEKVEWINRDVLAKEIKNNPEKYTPFFPTAVELLLKL